MNLTHFNDLTRFSLSTELVSLSSLLPTSGLKYTLHVARWAATDILRSRFSRSQTCGPRGRFLRFAMHFGNFQIISICVAKCLQKRCREI